MRPNLGLIVELSLMAALLNLPPEAGAQSAGTLSFAPSTYTVSESVGTAQVTVTRSGATSTTVSVHYETQDGQARAGSDYTAQTGTLTFGPNETLKTISIQIFDDDIPEGDEAFGLFLSNPTGGAQINQGYSYVTIRNNESFVQFSAASYTVNEFSGFALITVTRTPNDSYVNIGYATSGGTATANLDYLTLQGTLGIGSDQTNATFAVPIFEDTLSEGSETVNLTLRNPFNVALGAPNTAVLTILNANSGVEFALATSEVNENGGRATIVVRRRGDTNVAFTVDYTTTTNGTAKGGVDYQPVSGSLTFTPGETNKQIDMPVMDDPLVNGDRTVILALSNPQSGTVLAEHDTHLLTIRDNEKPAVVAPGFNIVYGNPESVQALAVQADGKVVIGGDFITLNGVGRIARLNPDGSLDAAFNPGSGADGPVDHLVSQADGKILAAGGFRLVNGAARMSIVRFNPDGSVDSAFNPTLDGPVARLVVQPDHKILIAGGFNRVNGASRNRIARLNPDGSLDGTFSPGTGVNNFVSALALQADGKVLIGGASNFASTNGVGSNSTARLHSDGSVDTGFTPAIETNSTVQVITLQGDGKAVLSGYVPNPNTGALRFFLVRLNADGSRDNQFVADPAARRPISSVVTLQDGRILAAGNGGFLLLNADGSRQSTFVDVFDASGNSGWVSSAVALDDGTAIIGGSFSSVSGTSRRGIARVFFDNRKPAFEFSSKGYAVSEDDGAVKVTVERLGETSGALTVSYLTLDSSATAGSDYSAQSGALNFGPLETSKPISIPILNDAFLESDESFNVTLRNPSGGALLGASVPTTVIILDDERPGSLDSRFNPTNLIYSDLGAYFPSYPGPPLASLLATTGGNVLLVSPNTGEFFRYHADGSLDSGFHPVTNGLVKAVALQTDGKILIGGAFSQVLGSSRANLARLNRDGSLDLAFNPQAGTDGEVQAIGLDASGNIVVAGFFGVVNGMPRSQVARLKPDGTLGNGLTNTFTSSIQVEAFTSVLIQADSKVVLTGRFVDGINGNPLGIIRLNADGSLDLTFPGAVGGQVNAEVQQSDGKLVIAGSFITVQGVRRPGIARLNLDGSLDRGFNVEVPIRRVCGLGCRWVAPIEALACQPDDKLIIGGTFSEVEGTPRQGIARLLPDGELDSVFDAGSGLVFGDPNYALPRPGQVRAIALQADGKVVIGGQFTAVNGISRWGLARVHGDEGLSDSVIYFAAATYSVSEDSDFAIIRVDRLGNVNSTVSVDFATADGTARAGLDYWPANDRLTFLPGQTTRYLALPLIEDGTPEPDETVQLRLTNPSGGAWIGLQPLATLRLLDNQRPGSLDWSFDPGEGGSGGDYYNPTISAVAVQPDGRIVIGGSFNFWNGASRLGIARLNPDGSLDTNYNPGTNLFDLINGPYPRVTGLAVQPDGKLLVNGVDQGIFRVTTSGTLDTNFPSGCCWGNLLAVRSDGKFLVSDGYSLTRFTSSGVDEAYLAFDFPGGFDVISALAVQPDNQLLVAFRSYSSQNSLIRRFHPDGATDPTLQILISGKVSGLALQPDGAILVAGGLFNAGGFSLNSIARFNTDGSLDTTFDPGSGAPVSAVMVQADGKIILAGEFISFNGEKRIGLVRLNGDKGYIQFDPPALGAGGQLRLGVNSQPGKTYILEVSDDLLHWSPIQTKIATGFGLDFTDTNTVDSNRRFYRIAAP